MNASMISSPSMRQEQITVEQERIALWGLSFACVWIRLRICYQEVIIFIRLPKRPVLFKHLISQPFEDQKPLTPPSGKPTSRL